MGASRERTARAAALGTVRERERAAGAGTAWTLDRRVPIAFVGAVLIQTFAALIWAGSAGERIAQVEREAVRVQELAERAARVEEQTRLMQAALARIETKLDNLNPAPSAR